MKLTTQDIFSFYPFFQLSSADERGRILQAAQRLSVPKGQLLFDKGQACQQVVLVGEGSIRVFAMGDTGREISLYHVTRGLACPINIMCVLLGRSAPATAIVDTTLEVVTLPAAAFRNWVQTEEPVRRFAIEAMGDRLVDVITLVEELVFQHVDVRLADFLLANFRSQPLQPIITMTHAEIAMELGSAREVITRILRDFTRRGLIKAERGRLTLLDEAGLQEVAND